MGDIPVLGIHEIAFEVRDLERSIAFYRDILGLSLYSRGSQQAWFCIGKLALQGINHDCASIIHARRIYDRRSRFCFPQESGTYSRLLFLAELLESGIGAQTDPRSIA